LTVITYLAHQIALEHDLSGVAQSAPPAGSRWVQPQNEYAEKTAWAIQGKLVAGAHLLPQAVLTGSCRTFSSTHALIQFGEPGM